MIVGAWMCARSESAPYPSDAVSEDWPVSRFRTRELEESGGYLNLDLPDSVEMDISVVHDVRNEGLGAGMGAQSPKHAAELKQYVDRCEPAALPAVAPLRVLDGFAGKGRRFRHGPGLLCGFRRGLFAVGSADLGKRRRWVAFRADSACETAQKLQVGFASR